MKSFVFFVGLWASVQATGGMVKVAELLTGMQDAKIKERTEAVKSHEAKVVNLNAMLTNARASLQRANSLATTNEAIKATTTANIKQFTSEIDQDQIEMTAAELNLKTETDRRAAENAQWEAEKQDLSQGLEAVRQAITTLDAMQEAHVPGTALIQQNAPNDEDMVKMMEAVAAVMDSVKVNFASKKDLEEMTAKKNQAFLQQAPTGRKGPQMNIGPANLGLEHGPGIATLLSKLRDMSHDIQGLIADGNKKEAEADDTFKLFKQQNEFTVTALKDSITSNNKSLATERSKFESAETIVNEANLQINQEKLLIDELQRQITAGAKAHTQRMQDFAKEEAVLGEALKNLGAAFFLQVDQRMNARAKGKIDPEVAQKVTEALTKSADKTHSTVLSQLANKVGQGMSFARLIKLINQMINTLKQGLKDLDSRDRWCKTELKNTFETFESWELKVKTLQLQWNVAAADVASKNQLLADLTDENSKAQQARVDLAMSRNEEKAAYERAKKETEEYIIALQKTLADLTMQYAGGGEGAEQANSLISLLKEIEGDLQDEATEIEVAEAQAETIYKQTDDDYRQGIALRDEMIKQTDRALVQLHGEQQDVQADLGDTKEALIAANDSKDAVQNGCEKSQEMSTEEKQAQLEAEISALKDAMAILES